MRVKDFYKLLEPDAEPDATMLPVLANLVDRFPIFQAGIFVYLKSLYLTDSPEFIPELTRLTPFVHDRRALFYYILRATYSKFRVKGKSGGILQDRTSVLIDAFFDAFGNDNSEVDHLLGGSIENATLLSNDYLSFIDRISSDEKQPDNNNTEEYLSSTDLKLKSQDLIDKFISESGESTNMLSDLKSLPEVQPYLIEDMEGDTLEDEDQDEDFFFTQTLVDIYIKQKKYDRAYEIIKRLNLNNPEKNIYFADRLSFLEKQIKIPNNK